jgi:uncharacterized membrane protein
MNNEIDGQDKIPLQMLISRILLIANVFTFGGLVSMLIVNRLLVAQLTIYGETYMAASSAILDFMDDILPYLAAYIISFLILTLATITVWIWAKAHMRYRRYGVAVLALVFVIMVVWLLSGQSTNISAVPMMTPTPIP